MVYDFLYRRGYFITDNESIITNFSMKNWNREKFLNYHIIHDPLLEINRATFHDVNVIIVGSVVDTGDNLINSQKIPLKMATKFKYSKDSFFEYLDTLSGRFILILADQKNSYILHDATGNRSVFYDITSKNIFISSHVEIIADLNDYKVGDEESKFMEDSDFRNNKDRYFPGIATPYKKIKMLTPNTLIDVKNKSIERYFPRESLSSEPSTRNLVEDLSNFFSNQIELLRSQYELSLSLTAGLDSRLSLATSKNQMEDIYYYTLIYGSDSEKDAQVASQLGKQLGINHHVIPTKSDANKDFLKCFLKNTSNMSSEFRGGIAETLCEKYPENRLHIKSNGSEICRAFYKQIYGLLPSKISPDVYSKLYGISVKSEFVQSSFKEFIDISKLNVNNIFNYDHYDLFYWEHRIGNWQSLCLMEWDIAQDTFIPFGNRNVIKKMLSIPLKDRINDDLYYDIIKNVWQECLQIPVNPFKKKQSFITAKRLARGAKLLVR
ncbi:hypothetical protein [Neobacillus vireti]|uniref:hypothetical protein n=1 Tax=Neobacillus vireti TaxID=220686 RepID=UPI002FFE055B